MFLHYFCSATLLWFRERLLQQRCSQAAKSAADGVVKHIIPLEKPQMEEKLGPFNGDRKNQACQRNEQQGALLLLHPAAAAKQSPQGNKEKQVQADLNKELVVSVEQHLAPGPQGHQRHSLLMASLPGEEREYEDKGRINDCRAQGNLLPLQQMPKNNGPGGKN